MQKKSLHEFQILNQTKYDPNLQMQANCISRATFYWTQHLMRRGAQSHLQKNDLFDLREQQQPIYAYNFNKQNVREIDPKVAFLYQDQNILYQLIKRLVGKTVYIACLIAVVGNGLQFAGPYVVKAILNFLADPQEPTYLGYVYATILFICFFFRVFILQVTNYYQHSLHLVNLAAVMAQNSINQRIYQKILRLSTASRKYCQTGKIMTLITVDSNSIAMFFNLCTFLVSAPVMIIVATGLIIYQVRWIGIAVPVIFFFGVIAQNKLNQYGFRLRKQQLGYVDKRSKTVNQYFSGIRIIKYYGWQNIVFDKIAQIRKKQNELNIKGLLLRSYVDIIMSILPIVISLLVFGVYAEVYGIDPLNQLQGMALDTAKVYTVLALFNLLAIPLRMIVMTIIMLVNALASLERIQDFLKYQERKTHGYDRHSQDLSKGAIECDGKYTWQSQQVEDYHNSLVQKQNKDKNIKQAPRQNGTSQTKIAPVKEVEEIQMEQIKWDIFCKLKLEPGTFASVIGKVGCGKTTLLHALMGQLNRTEGYIKLNGTLSYIPQTPYLRSTTIKNNILFQSQFDQQKYQNILKICQLNSDLAILPGGDQTEVGEKGVNLSGGQKQRIAIARALYKDSDIYLIDDCLSALDHYVGKSIFNNVIKGVLKNKTVVFVTHAIHYAVQADIIFCMNSGKIVQAGCYQQMKQGCPFFKELTAHLKTQQQQEQKQIQQKQTQKKEQVIKPDKQKGDKVKGALVKVEERVKGSVPWSVYTRYFKGAGCILNFLVFSTTIISIGSRIASDWWVGAWSRNFFNLQQEDYPRYIWIYALITIGTFFMLLSKGYSFAYFITYASQAMQRMLIQVLLRSPLSWFDITPTGRIIARTTKDQDDIDTNLAFNLQYAMQNGLLLLSTIIMTGVITPPYFIQAAILLVLYYLAIRYYLLTARQVKRLQANTKSPLITHFQQTINGIYVIRAMQKDDIFTAKFFLKQKDSIVAFTNMNITNRWISVISDLFGAFILAGAAYFGVLSKTLNLYDDQNSNNNLIGLSITWSLQLSGLLSFTLKMMSDTQNCMNAVLRIIDYIDTNPSQADNDQPKAPQNWPSQGKVDVENITYRYRPQLDDVIHGISFKIKSSQKIGVVGRTGSGKSTLTLGMLRILQLSKDKLGNLGKIMIDGIDIKEIGLHQLRHKITIIPQDPVIFTGTMKQNIDPFDKFSNQEISSALKKAQIWDSIKQNSQYQNTLQKKIYSIIQDGGSNFSLGQRQLICMARALVRKPKVLLMDQATASIDEMTDGIIQKMIKTQFADVNYYYQTTVITIAHRLNTIIQYSQILVLDYGQIMQYDKPLTLLQKDSHLKNLIGDPNSAFYKNLIALAREQAL